METVLGTVPCRGCGHRIGRDHGVCPNCGSAQRRKWAPITPNRTARPVGRCSRCGGRMRRDRGLVTRVLALIQRRRGQRRFACSSCGHRERIG